MGEDVTSRTGPASAVGAPAAPSLRVHDFRHRPRSRLPAFMMTVPADATSRNMEADPILPDAGGGKNGFFGSTDLNGSGGHSCKNGIVLPVEARWQVLLLSGLF